MPLLVCDTLLKLQISDLVLNQPIGQGFLFEVGLLIDRPAIRIKDRGTNDSQNGYRHHKFNERETTLGMS